jgi:hypothetical protein
MVEDRPQTVLGYETPAPLRVGDPPPPRRPMVLFLTLRQMIFAIGVGLLVANLGTWIVKPPAADVAGWGAALVGLCVRLGPLPWFMNEDVPPPRPLR